MIFASTLSCLRVNYVILLCLYLDLKCAFCYSPDTLWSSIED